MSGDGIIRALKRVMSQSARCAVRIRSQRDPARISKNGEMFIASAVILLVGMILVLPEFYDVISNE
jgi:hypothetical protein